MSEKVIVDASLSIKWVMKEPLWELAESLRKEWRTAGIRLCAPSLWLSEVDSFFRRKVYRRQMTQEDADKAQHALDLIHVAILDASKARQRAREIAEQANQERVYDSLYAALAEIEECEFWTADEAFFKAVRGFLSHVKYLGDYSIASEDISEENCAPINKQ